MTCLPCTTIVQGLREAPPSRALCGGQAFRRRQGGDLKLIPYASSIQNKKPTSSSELVGFCIKAPYW